MTPFFADPIDERPEMSGPSRRFLPMMHGQPYRSLPDLENVRPSIPPRHRSALLSSSLWTPLAVIFFAITALALCLQFLAPHFPTPRGPAGLFVLLALAAAPVGFGVRAALASLPSAVRTGFCVVALLLTIPAWVLIAVSV